MKTLKLPSKFLSDRGILLSCMLVVTSVGCGRGTRVQFVEGLVTLDGEPVEKAVVLFTPVDGGRAAAGTTDANGVYRLNPLAGPAGGGTLAGEYRVAVRRTEYQDPGPMPDASDGKAYAAWQMRSMRAARQEPTYITPRKYADAVTSGLKVIVRQGRNTGEEFHFDLRSEANQTE